MNIKSPENLLTEGSKAIIAIFVIQFILNLGIFVKYSDMTAYAVSKDQFSVILQDLEEIKRCQRFILEKLITVK